MADLQVARKTLVIDADAHVVETEHTWDFMDKTEERYRPALTAPPDKPDQKFWSIGGRRRGFRFNALTAGGQRADRSGRRVDLPEAVREMDDVAARLAVMDETGIDVQVCHNTLWIEPVTEEQEVDLALTRSWNRWLAEIWSRGEGRIRWTCVVPTTDLDEAMRQAEYAKANGAVGVCLRPIEGNRLITDPYFFPIFEAAQDLDLPITVHIANSNEPLLDLVRQAGGGFAMFRVPAVIACYSVLMNNMAVRFPRLRWGFIEASAQWLPWIASEVKHRNMIGRSGEGAAIERNPLQGSNIYVTCQNEDDIPYLLKEGFEENLVIGTDFGHFDASSDVDAISKFIRNNSISADAKEKILYNNPKALYNI